MLPSRLPEPDLYLPGTGEPSLRWGVVGPGWIADEFAKAVRIHTTQRIVAVASRSLDRAASFAATHGIDLALDSTEELLSRPGIDVVYVATQPAQLFPRSGSTSLRLGPSPKRITDGTTPTWRGTY